MRTQHRSGRGLISLAIILVLGMVLGGGLVAVHSAGYLTPLYHKLGLPSLHEQNADQSPAVATLEGDYRQADGYDLDANYAVD